MVLISFIYLTSYHTGHSKSVEVVVFSPDTKALCSGSWDRTAILWDIQVRFHSFCTLYILQQYRFIDSINKVVNVS